MVLKLRIRYASGLDVQRWTHRPATVELSEEPTLESLKKEFSVENWKQVSLSLGSVLLESNAGKKDGDTTLRSLGIVNNDLIWVTSVPPEFSVPLQERQHGDQQRVGDSPLQKYLEVLPDEVKTHGGCRAATVRGIAKAALLSFGFEEDIGLHNAGGHGNYALCISENPNVRARCTVIVSIMPSSCVLLGGVKDAGGVSKFLRLENIDSHNSRVCLFHQLKDTFCMPLLRECCKVLGVDYPWPCLANMPEDLIRLILSKCDFETVRSVGLVKRFLLHCLSTGDIKRQGS
jgi:hypothetical protein